VGSPIGLADWFIIAKDDRGQIRMTQPDITPEIEKDFAEITQIIETARKEARKIANRDPDIRAFLCSPVVDEERDLHRQLLRQLKDFVCESEPDLCFIGLEYPLQVGLRDFELDLLFLHRGLNCLVAIELKVGRFEPEYLGKLNFYLEALDQDVRKAHENPAIGILLCASQDDEVVEYALNRSLSPALIAEYQTQLPDKALWLAKLQEFYALNGAIADD
jgi:predicted nuclease of restriction endonuclease-like (RecB) superfamily